MKKSILTLTAALLLGTVGASFAQTFVGVGSGSAAITSAQNAQSKVTVMIPTVLLLKINGSATGGASPTVTFDFTSGQGLADYQTQLGATTPAPIAYSNAIGSTTFSDIQVRSNSGAATVSATISNGSSASGKVMPNTDVYLLNSAGGASFSYNSSTAWQTVASANDFAVLPDPGVAPESYTFTVTYTAVSN